MKFVAIVAIGMICLGAILMILALAGALGSWLSGLRAGPGQDEQAKQGVVGRRRVAWLLLCGVAVVILGISVLLGPAVYFSWDWWLGVILMIVTLAGAIVLALARLSPDPGQDGPPTKGLAGGRWFHWMLVCGVVLVIQGTSVLLLNPRYVGWVLFLWALVLAMVGIGWRWGVAAAARFSAWLFILVVIAAVLFPLLARPTSGPPPAGSRCLSNLKQVGLALLMYAEDYDDKLPAAGSWREAILPYSRNEQILVCPATGKRYIFNEALGGKDINEIDNPGEVPVAWDARADNGRPPHQGKFNVCFLDEHVELLDEGAFSQLCEGWRR